jgi:hypothetical protein
LIEADQYSIPAWPGWALHFQNHFPRVYILPHKAVGRLSLFNRENPVDYRLKPALLQQRPEAFLKFTGY